MKLLRIRLKLHTDLSIVLNINVLCFIFLFFLHIIKSFHRFLHIYILHKHIPIKFKNVLLEIPRISLSNFQKSRRTNQSLKNESTPSIFQFLIILKILWTHWKPLTPTKRPLIETIFLLARTLNCFQPVLSPKIFSSG